MGGTGRNPVQANLAAGHDPLTMREGSEISAIQEYNCHFPYRDLGFFWGRLCQLVFLYMLFEIEEFSCHLQAIKEALNEHTYFIPVA